MLLVVGSILTIILILLLIIVSINQRKIIKSDKEFEQSMLKRIDKGKNKIDVNLYKRIVSDKITFKD